MPSPSPRSPERTRTHAPGSSHGKLASADVRTTRGSVAWGNFAVGRLIRPVDERMKVDKTYWLLRKNAYALGRRSWHSATG